MNFLYEGMYILIKITLKFVPGGQLTISQYMGSGNSFTPNMRQDSIWTNDGLNYWCIYVSFDLYELTHWGLVTPFGDIDLI